MNVNFAMRAQWVSHKLIFLVVLLFVPRRLHAELPCRWIHGRARSYSGDGQVRIWHIGTNHAFSPSGKDDGWDAVINRIEWDSDKQMFADFYVCPTEPYIKGATQSVIIRYVRHAHVVPWLD